MGRDLAIDLGTANTLVYRQGEGIVFNEPTVVAMTRRPGAVEAMGEEAWQMIGGRSGNVIAVRPLRHGVMTEFDITQRMIEFGAAAGRGLAVPQAPRARVHRERELRGRAPRGRRGDPLRGRQGGRPRRGAARRGDRRGSADPRTDRQPHRRHRWRDDGDGGRLDGRDRLGRVDPVGGFDLDAAIQEHIRTRYGVAIGEKAAEEIKIAIGSAFPVLGARRRSSRVASSRPARRRTSA